MVNPTDPVVEEHVVQVALANGQMIAIEDSRPALIRVHGEAIEESQQLLPDPSEQG